MLFYLVWYFLVYNNIAGLFEWFPIFCRLFYLAESKFIHDLNFDRSGGVYFVKQVEELYSKDSYFSR